MDLKTAIQYVKAYRRPGRPVFSRELDKLVEVVA